MDFGEYHHSLEDSVTVLISKWVFLLLCSGFKNSLLCLLCDNVQCFRKTVTLSPYSNILDNDNDFPENKKTSSRSRSQPDQKLFRNFFVKTKTRKSLQHLTCWGTRCKRIAEKRKRTSGRKKASSTKNTTVTIANDVGKNKGNLVYTMKVLCNKNLSGATRIKSSEP